MEKEHTKKNSTIHHVLGHSYFVFLLIVILGVLFDLLFKKRIFSDIIYQYVGFFIMIVSSIIIFWAQKTSSNYKERELKEGATSHFEQGPYQYLRNPTYLGLFMMTLGFGLVINSFFSVVFTIIAYILTKIIFLKKEEKILEKKYGENYNEYKKKVKNWI